MSEIEQLRAEVERLQQSVGPDDDPWGFPAAQRLLALERAETARALAKLRPGNRFRLMFGQPLLPEP